MHKIDGTLIGNVFMLEFTEPRQSKKEWLATILSAPVMTEDGEWSYEIKIIE